MGANSKIAWTDHSFNPVIGCTKVSEGCRHCYAEAMNKRTGGDNWGPGALRRVTSASYWRQPAKWDRDAEAEAVRRRVFCGSMCDWADAEWPPGVRERMWQLIRLTAHLDWLLLTKRPERIAECLPSDWGQGYPNVWLGTTVEDQAAADKRIPILLGVPAVVRFLSCEPLIGPVNLRECAGYDDFHIDALDTPDPSCRVSWVIAGGESGSGARPMHADWARILRDQCDSAKVPFFLKQWGGARPGGETLLDGREWHQFPGDTLC